jgi:tetratricopeptide (TPR) repeat protein
LEYVQKTADLKIYGHQIADDYNNLAQALYQYDDSPQVIECYNRYIEIRKVLVDDSSYLDLACAYKELAAIYSRDSSDTAIESYKQALDQFSHIEDNTAKIHMAMCWCEIGCLLAKHDVGTFIRAFELLLPDTDNESNSFNTHNIAQCYLCLAKSYARSSDDVSLALVAGQQSLCLFLQVIDDALEILGDEQEILKDDLDGYWELLLPLHQKKSRE